MNTSRLLWPAVLAVAVVLATGCESANHVASAAPVVWGNRVPTAPPAAVANQPVVARGPNSITLMPISPTGARINVAYGYEMPHCGLNSPIDVDGSFWDPLRAPETPAELDGEAGTFILDAPNEATFSAPNGDVLHLTRHVGAEVVRVLPLGQSDRLEDEQARPEVAVKSRLMAFHVEQQAVRLEVVAAAGDGVRA